MANEFNKPQNLEHGEVVDQTPQREDQKMQRELRVNVPNPFLSAHARELALAHFNHVEQQVALAATTAGLLVAADALLLGGFLSMAKDFNVFSEKHFTVTGLLLRFAAASIVLALVSSLIAVFPNISVRRLKHPNDSVLFFGSVGRQPFKSYLSEFIKKDASNADGLYMDMLSQIYNKSAWLNSMFVFLRLAVVCTILGTVLTALALVLFAPSGPST